MQNTAHPSTLTLTPTLQFSIATRPHVRASKKKCWERTGVMSGYLRWREMQLFLNW